ncbi:cytochrome c1 [Metallibacterium sp.]|uniref:cytochrome c1 n=1 Tax=Metallibacterium sp. TaxID=2940281 RepID=UPI002617D1F8|nr:cytochrome c1 [Metallibacterium sp.]
MNKRMFSGLLLALALISGPVLAQEATPALYEAHVNLHDMASVQRGARIFFNYCAGCHSLQYMRYSRISHDLGLSEQQVMTNLDFNGVKFGDHAISSMPAADATKWFGKAPPDLSLEVRAKGADWVYSYLKSFYLDPTRPVGWNNTVFPNASMPNPLWELQGMQTAVYAPSRPGEGAKVDKLDLNQPGLETPEQFDRTARDVTAFLTYVAEPNVYERERVGLWVLLYLVAFSLLAVFLKREYWKDIH